MAYHVRKTEHSGPKHGKGYWGLRSIAKAWSKISRRLQDKKVTEEEYEEMKGEVLALASEMEETFCGWRDPGGLCSNPAGNVCHFEKEEMPTCPLWKKLLPVSETEGLLGSGTMEDPFRCCNDPQVRGGCCVNCGRWVEDK